jgi:hypothetical protein
MNLNSNPTVEQLRELIRRCNDSAGHHVLWVKKSGEVELSSVPQDQTPIEFQEAHPNIQIRFETFLAGNEYVGPEAAEDEEWVSELFDRLVKEWSKAKGKPDVTYIGNF